MRKIFVAALLAGAAMAAQPANAALVPSGAACAASDIGLPALPSFQCVGFYEGNLASNATSQDQTDALALLGLALPDAFNNSIQKLDSAPKLTGTSINFDQMLVGVTYIGLHVGNVPLPGGGKVNNVTAFYRFDAGLVGIDVLTLGDALKAISNATLYKTGTPPPVVPEPASWALLISGFALAGTMLRRRATKVQFA